MIATNGVLFKNAEKVEISSIIRPMKPFIVLAFWNIRSNIASSIPVLFIISPISSRRMITNICSLANPLNISLGVRIPKKPSVTTATTNVKVAPKISLYREIRMNNKTINTMMISKVIIGKFNPLAYR